MIKEDIPCFENSLKNCIYDGEEHNCVYRIKRPDNEIRWIDCRGKLEKDKLSIIGTIQDITQNKTLEIEKHQKEELLYQQSKMAAMGEMIGNIAHQWRQPLSVISTAATGLKIQKEMSTLPDEELYSSLTAINTSAQYLSSTIEDFRNFFNSSNNKVSEFDIADAFSKTLNLIKAQFTSKDIEIIQDIVEFKIASIENELVQVLINILNNARDALISKETQRKLIFINTYTKDNTLCIEIKDNAGGIKEDIIDRIFEPYFTTKHKSQGIGIGLYMSKEIIEKHLEGIVFVSNEKYTFENIEYTGAKFNIEITNIESNN
jgi:signal transduction histidine kinase